LAGEGYCKDGSNYLWVFIMILSREVDGPIQHDKIIPDPDYEDRQDVKRSGQINGIF